MNLSTKIACLALLMNTHRVLGQEGVRFKTVKVDGLNTFYREAGPTSGPVILLLHGVPTSPRVYQPVLESPLSAGIASSHPTFRTLASPYGLAPRNSTTPSTIRQVIRLTEALRQRRMGQ